ncbi:hypothetical protein GBAR_LOCUS22547 [Geodia barretti]|nr:hypothetical protein GBAR_LOCUS22547 [Geodia barretti]
MVTSATPTPTPMLSSVELRTSSQSRSSVATSTLPSSSVVATTIPPTRQQTGDDVDIVLIGAIVGGVVAAALVLTVLVLCLCLCIRRLRSGRVDLNKQDKKNGRDVELGHYQQKPQIGSDHYRAVSSYHPQTSDSGDLALEEGEWVTLLEAPPGGQWWRGQTAAGEGWFPKSHVQLVDREAEHRKAEEENFKLAAAAIRAASNSFNEKHLSLTTKNKATPTSSRRTRAATTFSKAEINSTPVLTAKFSTSVLDSVVIENQRHLSASTASGGSRPHTPTQSPRE